jgi:pimeloyl-ACP methyl ester carboxylesterase
LIAAVLAPSVIGGALWVLFRGLGA